MTELNHKCANLIIAGFGKAGTTSLFEYLSSHPDICGSAVKETKFFMPLKFRKPLPSLNEYSKFWSHSHGQKYLLDASPSYGFGGRALAESMKKNLREDLKLIFILREPVSKVFSWYRYMQSTRLKIPMEITFEKFLEYSFNEIDLAETEFRDTPYSKGVSNGLYIKALPIWFELFGKENIKLFFYDDLRSDSKKIVTEICNWLKIDPSLIDETKLHQVANKTMNYRSGRIHKVLKSVSNLIPSSMKRSGSVFRSLKKTYNKFSQVERNDQMNAETKKNLHEFFQPHNKLLAEFLKEKGYSDLPLWLK